MKIILLEDSDRRIEIIRKRFSRENLFVFKDPIDCFHFTKKIVSESNDNILMLLDHDLEFFEFTPYKRETNGSDFVKMLIQEDLFLSNKNRIRIVIHSLNPVGGKNMKQMLLNNDFQVVHWPFGKQWLAENENEST